MVGAPTRQWPSRSSLSRAGIPAGRLHAPRYGKSGMCSPGHPTAARRVTEGRRSAGALAHHTGGRATHAAPCGPPASGTPHAAARLDRAGPGSIDGSLLELDARHATSKRRQTKESAMRHPWSYGDKRHYGARLRRQSPPHYWPSGWSPRSASAVATLRRPAASTYLNASLPSGAVNGLLGKMTLPEKIGRWCRSSEQRHRHDQRLHQPGRVQPAQPHVRAESS